MDINMISAGDELTVEVAGRLDTLTSPEFESKLVPALEGVKTLIVDLKDLEYISSAGLRVLLTAMQIMDGQGKMSVRNVNETVMNVFEVTGFAEDLNIE